MSTCCQFASSFSIFLKAHLAHHCCCSLITDCCSVCCWCVGHLPAAWLLQLVGLCEQSWRISFLPRVIFTAPGSQAGDFNVISPHGSTPWSRPRGGARFPTGYWATRSEVSFHPFSGSVSFVHYVLLAQPLGSLQSGRGGARFAA